VEFIAKDFQIHFYSDEIKYRNGDILTCLMRGLKEQGGIQAN